MPIEKDIIYIKLAKSPLEIKGNAKHSTDSDEIYHWTESQSQIPCQELHTFLLSLGFVTSHADTSFFGYSCGNALLYFLVYVDDLIITGSDPSLVDTIIQ